MSPMESAAVPQKPTSRCNRAGVTVESVIPRTPYVQTQCRSMSGTGKDLAERVALVTGAASGIGRASALALARAGAGIAAVDIDPRGLGDTVELLRTEGADVL